LAHVTLLVGLSCEDVARHLPFFDEVQWVDDRALMAEAWWKKLGESWRILRSLSARATTYSGVFIFHRDWRYGLLMWAARIPVRRGLSRKGAPCFLTHPCVVDEKEHHVGQYLAMVCANVEGGTGNAEQRQDRKGEDKTLAGVWSFVEGEQKAALEVAAQHGFKPVEGKWIALGFGGGRNVKTRTELKWWPLAYYRELARQLVRSGYHVAWVGDAEDARLLGDEWIGVNLAGKLRVDETAGVLSACERVVTNDTLTLHLAEALGIPTLALFGPTDPAHYRPLNAHSAYLWHGKDLACSPCHRDGYFPPCAFQHECMESLTVESVLQKIMEARG